mmetsp:Transcript_35613/g.115430  ORF Transcript_35613/g.115430 Transcript_35613/m.115430 type:complete len:249 (-) Transcript_35613:1064-1810(-)
MALHEAGVLGHAERETSAPHLVCTSGGTPEVAAGDVRVQHGLEHSARRHGTFADEALELRHSTLQLLLPAPRSEVASQRFSLPTPTAAHKEAESAGCGDEDLAAALQRRSLSLPISPTNAASHAAAHSLCKARGFSMDLICQLPRGRQNQSERALAIDVLTFGLLEPASRTRKARQKIGQGLSRSGFGNQHAIPAAHDQRPPMCLNRHGFAVLSPLQLRPSSLRERQILEAQAAQLRRPLALDKHATA